MQLGTSADSWKRTGTARPKLNIGGGGERGEENRERVKGKMTPTLRNMVTVGRTRRKLDIKKPLLLVGANPYCVGGHMM